MIEIVCCPFNVYMSASAIVSLAWCLFKSAVGHVHSNGLCPSFFFICKQTEGSWGFSFHWPLRQSGEATRGSLTFMPPALTMQHSLAAVNKVVQYVVRRAASSSGCREKKTTTTTTSLGIGGQFEKLQSFMLSWCRVAGEGFAGSYSSSRRAKAGLNPGQADGSSQSV